MFLRPPPGGMFRENFFTFTFWEKGWAISFPKGIFVSNDGLYGRLRQNVFPSVRRAITKNNGKRFLSNRLPFVHFQSLKISSIALSIAAFKLIDLRDIDGVLYHFCLFVGMAAYVVIHPHICTVASFRRLAVKVYFPSGVILLPANFLVQLCSIRRR